MKSQFPKETEKRDWNSALIILTGGIAVALLVLACNLLFGSRDEEISDLTAYPIEEEVYQSPVIITEEVSITQEAQPDVNDRDIMALIVASEAKGEKFIGKVAVAAVVLNRARLWNKSIEEIALQENQFAYPYYGKVSVSCYEAVDYAMSHTDMFPKNMIYFRNHKYHKYGKPYVQIGRHYFSTEGDPEWDLENLGEGD